MFLDPRHQCQSGVFEDSAQWLPDLESAVQAAAAKVYGATGVAPAFFSEQLLELLEDLAINLTVAGAPVGTGWAARLLLRVHTFSYPLLVDVYVQMLDTWARSVPEKMVQNISSLAYVLSKWIALADEYVFPPPFIHSLRTTPFLVFLS